MFHEWDSFYLLIGSAAGALIGLLFVVTTLTERVDRDSATRGERVYMTPTVFHFAMVLVISAMALTPHLSVKAAGLIIGACALVVLVYATAVSVQLAKGKIVPNEVPHWSDFWFYGVAPTVIYLGLLVAAVAVWTDAPCAPYDVAVTMLILLLASIRNAWDLVTWLVPHETKD